MISRLSPLGLAARRPGVRGVIVNEHVLTAAQARAHVDALGRWFDFVHHDDLPERMERPGRRPFCLLTFDDGKRNNADTVAPELERLGVPAVFYVVTRFLMDAPEPLWFDRMLALRRSLGALPPALADELLKQLPHRMRRERLERACREHGADADLADENVAPMTPAQARSLARRGFTVGAHSRFHEILPREREEEARESIALSIAEVEEMTGLPCRTFAFPNGNYTAALCRHAREAGARTVMTTEPVWVTGASEVWALPRVQLFGGQDRKRIERKLLVSAGGVLGNPDGTGRLYRRIARLRRAFGRRAASSERTEREERG